MAEKQKNPAHKGQDLPAVPPFLHAETHATL